MLAIIPARKGSKGIPGKALRTVGGIPLILRTLRTVTESGVADRIVVSTDCPEIQSFCQLRGYEVLMRPAELAGDDVPLMDVARHVVHETRWEATVAIFQPTCPMLTPETVRRVVDHFYSNPTDDSLRWTITASPDPHIHWCSEGLLTPRTQRQELDDIEVESGAVQLMGNAVARGEFPATRSTFVIDPREALDIDTPDDLMLAEKLCSLRKIHFVVLMGPRVGTGHFHRCKALAEALSHHDITWEWVGEPPEWARRQIPYAEGSAGDADLAVFDCLAPDTTEIHMLRAQGTKVVALEDEQSDRHLADLTINAMLNPPDLKYADLRSEFLGLPEREHRPDACDVLLTFGGMDPARVAFRCMPLLDYDYTVYWDKPGQLGGSMAQKMREVDLVVTSQGRTVFEAAACGTPIIAIAANEREARHVRIPGVTYLGLHSTVTDDQIKQAVKTTLADVELRREHAKAASAAIDGRGLDRLVRRIEGLIE